MSDYPPITDLRRLTTTEGIPDGGYIVLPGGIVASVTYVGAIVGEKDGVVDVRSFRPRPEEDA